MSVQKDVIYRVYRFLNLQAPYSLFIWDMIEFESTVVLKNIVKYFPNCIILSSAITARIEDSDEVICDFETLEEIVAFTEELHIYKLILSTGEVEISIENEDQLSFIFSDLNLLPHIIQFAKEQLDIIELEKYLTCVGKPNVYHCFDYYGKFIECRDTLGDLKE
ncbi:MAG: hypothetical protein IT244_05140 [Bacteroidia bacterium]|nr:hypothetical protein [Bacteroidia bacterium]